MYYFEWLIYDGRATVDYNTLARQADAQKQKNEKLPSIRIDQKVSTKITSNDSLYSYSSTYIDIRTPNDEKRGLITLMIGGCGAILFWLLGMTLHHAIRDILAGYKGDQIPLIAFDY